MRTLVSIALALLVGCSPASPGGRGGKDSSSSDTAARDEDADRDGSPSSEDCDDRDPAVHPGAAEVCDGYDNDCDGLIDGLDPDLQAQIWYTDADGDGYGDDASAVAACTQPEDALATGGDCDDSDAAYHPGAAETDCADANDYNCDGLTGANDGDGDGTPACQDCDDTNAAISPSASEVCDGVDNDCDGLIDDADTDVSGGSLFYVDADGDGYGEDDAAESGCTAPAGTSATGGDCDDTDPATHPGAAETDCADPHDYNCDGSVAYADMDGDGAAACVDCDDSDPSASPGATEICDGVDNDCDGLIDDDDSDVTGKGTWYADGDSDGYGLDESATEACNAPWGTVGQGGDCDDTDAAINPDGTEICDGVDDDCDGLVDDADSSLTGGETWYTDADGDGYGDPDASVSACEQPTGTVASSSDCDDTDAATNPDGTEICDGVDDDCDGLIDDADSPVSGGTSWYVDADGDGYGDPGSAVVVSCVAPDGTTDDDTDCDDAEASVNPGAAEACDALDNNCNDTIDDGDVCPCTEDWYGDHAYMFCHDTLSQSRAATSCESYGYSLVTLNDADENAFVHDDAYTVSRYSSWWIGLTDSAHGGTFVWADGSTPAYTSWGWGEPSGGKHTDCVALEPRYSSDWYNRSCDEADSYVCETP